MSGENDRPARARNEIDGTLDIRTRNVGTGDIGTGDIGTGQRLLLGIDTGGTYTDAVLIDEATMAAQPRQILAKAKALTTRDDLARGIGAAVDEVLGEARLPASRIAMVALSTTLATNALVEGQGGRAVLIMIGFDDADLSRQGLAEARGDSPVISIAGGHDAMGQQKMALDGAGLQDAIAGLDASAYAICAHFAVRNPGHEREAREIIRDLTGCPVTCSHELSAQVGGPKRGLTALLNARLIGMIDRLIDSAETLIAARGIDAPLMVVRGDGALVSARFARNRPIETILSGPAASLVGAGWLTGLEDAVISDIGGTTTDIAVLRGGRPRLDPEGARVGGMRTMVEAVAMRTFGLGGDSEVGIAPTGINAALVLGPRRVIPISLLATMDEAAVHHALNQQLSASRSTETDGRFLVRIRDAPADIGEADRAFLTRLGDGPVAEEAAYRSRMDRMAAKRLIARGIVAQAGITPSDAAHLLGLQSGWDRDAAEKALTLFARQRGNDGKPLATDATTLAQQIVRRLQRLSAERVLEAALAEDGFEGEGLAIHPLARAALDRNTGLIAPGLRLTTPLIGLGASAETYYPGIANLLDAVSTIPAHADVANAIGAVVGHVRLTQTGIITAPRDGQFRAHLPDGPRDFTDEPTARDALQTALTETLRQTAQEAGASDIHIATHLDRQEAVIEGQPMLIEATLTLTATGRPRLAEPAPTADLPPGFSGV